MILYDELGRKIQSPDPNITPVQVASASPPIIAPNPPVQSQTQQIQPVNIPMASAGPAETQALALSQQMPQIADYPQSRGRTILNAIAAGLAGASGGPQVGLQTAKSLTNVPYQRALEDWQRRVAALQLPLQTEAAQYARGAKGVELGETEATRRQSADIAAKQQQIEADRLKEKDNYDRIRLDIERDKINKPSQLKEKLNYLKDPNLRKELEYLYELKNEGKRKTREEKAAEEEDALKLRQKYAKTIAMATEEGYQEVKKKAGEDPDLLARALTQRQQNPQFFENWLKAQSTPQKSWLLRVMDTPPFLPAKEQTAYTSAKTTLGHLDSLKEMIKDPYIKANIGPIVGRIQSAEGAVGGNPVGATPEQAQKEQQFLSFLTLYMIWESTNLSGGNRPAWQLIQAVKSASPAARMTPERFMGAIDAGEKSIGNRMAAIMGGYKVPGQEPAQTKEKQINVGGRTFTEVK